MNTSKIDDLFDEPLLDEFEKIEPIGETLTYRQSWFKRTGPKFLLLGGSAFLLILFFLKAVGGAPSVKEAPKQENPASPDQELVEKLRLENSQLQGENAIREQRNENKIAPPPKQKPPEAKKAVSERPVSVPLPSRVYDSTPPRIPAPRIVATSPTRQSFTSPLTQRYVPATPAIRSDKPAIDPEEQWETLKNNMSFKVANSGVSLIQYKSTKPIAPISVEKPLDQIPIVPKATVPLGTTASGELVNAIAWTKTLPPEGQVLIRLIEDFGTYKKGDMIVAQITEASGQVIRLSTQTIQTEGGDSQSLSGVTISASGGRPLIGQTQRSGGGNQFLKDVLGIGASVGLGALSNRSGNQRISFNNGQVSSIDTVGDSVLGDASDQVSRLIQRNNGRSNNAKREVEYFFLKAGTKVQVASLG